MSGYDREEREWRAREQDAREDDAAERRAEVGDDWAADALAEVEIANREEELKTALRARCKQIESLEAQIRERDEVIRELQQMIGRMTS